MSGNQQPPAQPPRHGAPIPADTAGDDPALQRELAELRQAWAVLEAPDPPELLDQAVLNTARRALSPPARKGSRLRWLGGLATAGVVVLAVSIVMQQDGHAPPAGEPFRNESLPAAPAAERSQRKALQSDAMAPAPAKPTAPESREAVAAKMAPPTLADEAVAAAAETQELLPADEWLQRLEGLRKEGASEAFQRELAAFRSAYPDYPIPADWPK